MAKFTIYKRVSTDRQGESGLGLDGQDRDIELFLSRFCDDGAEVIGTFIDVQSGADDDRPQLREALELVRKTPDAELLVAKLDRLSRRVSFIATLLDDRKVKLRVASMPHADKFQLHIYAALAEQEREFISARTKLALAASAARGTKLGGLRPKTERRIVALKTEADARARKLAGLVSPLRASGATLAEIGEALARAGIPAPRGGNWRPQSVANVLARLDRLDAPAR